MIKVRNAEALSGYRLDLKFSDGTSGIADLSKHVKRKPFRALEDENVFGHIIVDRGAVEWPDGDVGIATEALYALAHDLPRPDTLEKARENELRVSLRELRRIVGMTQDATVRVRHGDLDGVLRALEAYITRAPELVGRG